MTVRTDLAVILVVIGVTFEPSDALALALAVLAHEAGHFLVARVVGGRGPLLLQVGSGRPYLKGVEGYLPTLAVLAAGGIAGLVPFTASLYMEYFGAKLRSAVVLWTLYQWLPFPTLDGGQLLTRTVLAQVERSLIRWRILWALGLVTVIVLGLALPQLVRWLVYFTAMALLLGRSEAAAMRYQDAYEAWEAGDHRAVIARAERVPAFFTDDEVETITLLGLSSARAVDDPDAMDTLAMALAPHHPERVRTAEQLLRTRHPAGLPLADDAFAALDQGRVTSSDVEAEQWADLAFHAASAEAAAGRVERALDRLERAATFGFDQLERLQADPELGPLLEQPRFAAVVRRLEASLAGTHTAASHAAL